MFSFQTAPTGIEPVQTEPKSVALPLGYGAMVDGEFLLNTAVLLNRFLFDFSEANAHSLRILSVSVPHRERQDSNLRLALSVLW